MSMSRKEQKYNWIEDIVVWSKGKYKREKLEKLTMPELFRIHNELYFNLMSHIY